MYHERNVKAEEEKNWVAPYALVEDPLTPPNLFNHCTGTETDPDPISFIKLFCLLSNQQY